ncbi:MAG: DciA family protein [Hyphomicrobiaceae bacterium]|nr:DciA family protein [Hyphomicrobiaceae bacterium]
MTRNGAHLTAARLHRPAPGKSVGAFLPALTRKAFETFGFASATLITDWPAIVGEEVARASRPARLVWPRAQAGRRNGQEIDAGRPPATLILHVAPARALEIEYARAEIAERINGYFGYRAVGQIKVLQTVVLSDGKGPAGEIARAAHRPASGSTSGSAKRPAGVRGGAHGSSRAARAVEFAHRCNSAAAGSSDGDRLAMALARLAASVGAAAG